MKAGILLIFILSAVTILNFPAKAAVVYAYMDEDDDKTWYSFYLSQKRVDGISVRIDWSELEIEDNKYNWKSLDEAVSSAYSFRKGLTLRIQTSDYAAPPVWLKWHGMKTYRSRFPYDHGRDNPFEPVPWDKIYMAKWEEFLKALADHLNEPKATASLRYISMATPAPEMNLVYCHDGNMSVSLKYSREWYLYAWQRNAEIMAKYFPQVTKFLPVPNEDICGSDGDGAQFFYEISKFSGSRFIPFAHDLNGYGSRRMEGIPKDIYPVSGLRFIHSYSKDPYYRFDGDLDDAICKAKERYAAGYFEVYKEDLASKDPGVRTAISKIDSSKACR